MGHRSKHLGRLPLVKMRSRSDNKVARAFVDAQHRVDYVLQESTTEGIVHSMHRMSIISAHSCYWSSRDLAMFMLKVLTGSHKASAPGEPSRQVLTQRPHCTWMMTFPLYE